MKNTFGNQVSVTLFGESHGPYIGATLDGLSAGVKIDETRILKELQRRKPNGVETSRKEDDRYQLVSGVFEGYTTGAPITVLVPNENTKSGDYQRELARPSHADYTAFSKYHGFEDYRGGGHFSGRLTVALVVLGAICQCALERKNVCVATHIATLGPVYDTQLTTLEQAKALKEKEFPVILPIESDMTAQMESVKAQGDSVGGMTESVIFGVEAGLGEPYFDSIESSLSHALFSIGGVKGVEFGLGFDFATRRGSESNDALVVQDGTVQTKTNHNGGINGGISNGMPIVFRCAIKPTPSIAKEQDTVNLQTNENTKIEIRGRHDPCIVRRIVPVIDALCAITLCDFYEIKYGTDCFTEERV